MGTFKKFLPSEIARLVYGYLLDVNDDISYTFLTKSPYLAECLELYNEGASFYTDFNGLTLKELLQEYALIHHIVNSTLKSQQSTEKPLENARLSEKLCHLLNFLHPNISRSRSSSIISSFKDRLVTNHDQSFQHLNQSNPSLSRSGSQDRVVSSQETISSTVNSAASSPRTHQQLEFDSSNCQIRNLIETPVESNEKTGSFVKSPNITPSSVKVASSAGITAQSSKTSPSLRIPATRDRRLVKKRSPRGELAKQLKELQSKPITILPSTEINIQSVNPVETQSIPESSGPSANTNVQSVTSVEPLTAKLNAQGTDQDTFLNKVDLSRDGDTTHAQPKRTRSRSCSDLTEEVSSSEKQRRLRARPRFFTPNKRRLDEPSEEAIKATLQKLFDDRELHEKIAGSINNAREEIVVAPETDELDAAIQNIIEKTTSDPAFDEIMNQTLSNYDLLHFLKPVAKPVTSVKDRLRSSARIKDNNSRCAEKRKKNEKNKSTDQLSLDVSLRSSKSLDKLETTAEVLPYPEIHYDPADVNIVTGTLDAEGNCLFFSDPKISNSGLILPPAPSKGEQRYRNILPKFEKMLTLRDIHPVVVCTPVMPSVALPPPLSSVQLPATKPVNEITRQKVPVRRVTKENKRQVKKKPVPALKEIPPTPGRVYTDDMPAINLFATPRQPALLSPPPPPPPPPEVTPDAPPTTRRQSLSTPRRKSYIRALEFETPQKGAETRKSATSPKLKNPPSASTTPNEKSSSGKKSENNKKSEVPEAVAGTSNLRPPIATRTPVKKKLSEAWDALTGVSCILGDTSTLATPENKKTETSQTHEGQTSASSLSTNESRNEVTVIAKTWDSDLRIHLSETEFENRKATPKQRSWKLTKKRKIRSGNNNQPKKEKKSATKRKKPSKISPSTRVTRSRTKIVTISPSKINVTSKRNTYAISNGSSSAFDSSSSAEEPVNNTAKPAEHVEMTPAKVDEPTTVAITEETPFTKLLRENVACVDIDISMIQTPFFPVTPLSQDPVTPMHVTRGTDYSSSSSYYKPELTSPASCLKDAVPFETVEELQRSEEYLEDISTVSGRNLVLSPERSGNQNKQNKITNYYKLKEPSSVDRTEGQSGSKTLECLQSLENQKSTLNTQKSFKGEEITKTLKADMPLEEAAQEKVAETNECKSSSARNRESGPEMQPDKGSNRDLKEELKRKNEKKENPPKSLKEKNIDLKNIKKIDKPSSQATEHEKIKVDISKQSTSDANSIQTNPHEMKINEIVEKGKEIIASSRRIIPGKNMSFFKLQMLAQCNIKLGQNIPIVQNGLETESSRDDDDSRQRDNNVMRKEVDKQELVLKELELRKQQKTIHEELEIKRLNIIEKMKKRDDKRTTGIKRSRKPLERPPKRVKRSTKTIEDVFSGPLVSSTPHKLDSDKSEEISEKPSRISSGSEETPVKRKQSNREESPPLSVKAPKYSDKISADIKKEIPSFVDDGEYPELPEKTKKKVFVIKAILQRTEVVQYLNNFSKDAKQTIVLKPSILTLFKTLFKWLKHPHQHELDASSLLRERIPLYLNSFKKINQGFAKVKSTPTTGSTLKSLFQEYKESCDYSSDGGSSIDSSIGVKWQKPVPKTKKASGEETKKRCNSGSGKTKHKHDDDKVSLPPKKRKNPLDISKKQVQSSTAQEIKSTQAESKTSTVEEPVVAVDNENNATHAQIILQEIDVDRFLSHVHGHDSSN